MRINCVLGPFLPVPPIKGGSVERIWLGLCTEFAARGHKVTIISRQYKNLPDDETIAGVRFLRVRSSDAPHSKPAYRILDAIYAMRVCRALPPADISVTNSVALPLMIPRSKAGRIYMSIARYPKRQMQFYWRVDRMQAVSSHVARAIIEQSPSVSSLVTTIPNSISAAFANSIQFPRETRAKSIVFVGRLAREKGIDILLRGFAAIHREFPDWRLTIVGPHQTALGGDGDAFFDELKALAASSGAPVTFAGPEFDEAVLAAHLKGSEVFVYPSIANKGEALPLAPVEAMACGCAVVVSSLDCFNDYLSGGENGLMFSSADATGADLAAKLRMLLSDAGLRSRLGSAAMKTACRYTQETIASLFLEDFHQLLSTS